MRLNMVAGAALIAMLPFGASAATLLVDGGTYNLSSDIEFSGTWNISTTCTETCDNRVTFGFNSGGVPAATAFAVTLDSVQTFVDSLTATWSSLANGAGTVYTTATTVPVNGVAQLLNISTAFPPSPQWLTVSWTGEPAVGQSALLNVEVAPVPVPAAGLMLVAGLGGLAALKRRKKA
jgi:hypothetical protein